MGSNPHRPPCETAHTKPVACRLGFARLPSQWLNDDSSDDNRDDSGPVNHAPYSPKMHVSCLVTAVASIHAQKNRNEVADRVMRRHDGPPALGDLRKPPRRRAFQDPARGCVAADIAEFLQGHHVAAAQPRFGARACRGDHPALRTARPRRHADGHRQDLSNLPPGETALDPKPAKSSPRPSPAHRLPRLRLWDNIVQRSPPHALRAALTVSAISLSSIGPMAGRTVRSNRGPVSRSEMMRGSSTGAISPRSAA
jgi:hypothetical protein